MNASLLVKYCPNGHRMATAARRCDRCDYRADAPTEQRGELDRTVYGTIEDIRALDVPAPLPVAALMVLVVSSGPWAGREVPLEAGVWRIGKNPSASDSARALPISEDGYLSREHVELVVGRAGGVLTDLDSTNGTFVNGTRQTSAVLTSGDRVHIGETEFTVRVPGSPS